MFVYNIIKQDYFLPTFPPEEYKGIDTTQIALLQHSTVFEVSNTGSENNSITSTTEDTENNGKLDKKKFEAFIRKNKPYLNKDLKITDLVKPLNSNRSVISSFINKNYKMNFSRYMNSLRLIELDRLISLNNDNKYDMTELVAKAGFGSYRNYMRAKKDKKEQYEL